MYVDLGSENGGFPLNLSEDGMAFQGMRPLQLDQELYITFKLSGVDEPIAAIAKIVWLTESRKGGALQFIDLPDATRLLIRDWLLKHSEAPRPRESVSPKKIAPIELDGVPTASVHPRAIARGYPMAALTADPAAKPSPSDSTPKADREVPPIVVTAAPPKPKTDLPPALARDSADSQQASRLAFRPARVNKRHGKALSYGLGVATSLLIMIACGMILRPFQKTVFRRSAAKVLTPAPVETAPSPVPAPLPEELPLAESSNDPALDASLQTPPAAIDQEHPSKLSSPIPAPAPSYAGIKARSLNATPSSSPINPRTSSAGNMGPRTPAILPVRNEAPATVSLNLAQGTGNELPGARFGGGKISALEAKPALIPPPTGSIEIISDPYPSIRIPAGSKTQLSRPGTSLQIGRLLSRVEPIYPTNALRQWIGGTVKAHVLIGPDGLVESSEEVNAPAALGEAALRAIRQWRYEPTLLGGMPIEVEEDITVIFRIASPRSPAN